MELLLTHLLGKIANPDKFTGKSNVICRYYIQITAQQMDALLLTQQVY